MTDTIDVYCIDDLSPTMATVTERTALAHSIARRLITPTGQASWWPQYGIDLREYLGSKVPRSAIGAAALIEIRKDERVSDAQVTVTEVTPTQIALAVDVQTVAGDVLQYTLRIGEVTLAVEGLTA